MKNIFIAVVALIAFSSFASAKETIEIRSKDSGQECQDQATEIIGNIKKFVGSTSTSLYTVTAREYADIGCYIVATLQDSKFELAASYEHTKSTAHKDLAQERFNDLVQTVKSRPGYLWHTAESSNFVVMKSKFVKGLYIIPKP